ncbi:hypothetical protein [Paludisphaera soli]|uniref:hypothetical protein n=1 Tax=Paludisphaera soli TaxID=2712865 RepID=UPI0013ED37E9|nr:hypothetical protein [Paludisphaera soli]
MRPGRMRFSVRGMMLAGIVVAVLLGGVAIPAWRHIEYGRKAALHAEAARRCRRLGGFITHHPVSSEYDLAVGPTEAQLKADAEAQAEVDRQGAWYFGLAERHEALAARYAAASARPWEALPPDPGNVPFPDR